MDKTYSVIVEMCDQSQRYEAVGTVLKQMNTERIDHTRNVHEATLKGIPTGDELGKLVRDLYSAGGEDIKNINLSLE